jgi:hypothetical protein
MASLRSMLRLVVWVALEGLEARGGGSVSRWSDKSLTIMMCWLLLLNRKDYNSFNMFLSVVFV